MDEIKVPEYFLHSRHGDSFHFRKVDTPNSILESFTISYIWDGACVMSGDYGDLTWQRSYYHGPEYCFPYPDTGIGYFAEKVHHRQIIKEWTHEAAMEDLKDRVETYYEDDEELPEELKEILENTGEWENQYEMINDLYEVPDFEEFYDFGERFTWHFRFQYEVLKQVSPLISEELKKADNAGAVPA